MKDQAAEATIAAYAQKVGLAGSGGALLFGFSVNEVAAAIGALVAIAGFAVQVYYKRKADRRAAAADQRDAEFHEKRLADLREYREGK